MLNSPKVRQDMTSPINAVVALKISPILPIPKIRGLLIQLKYQVQRFARTRPRTVVQNSIPRIQLSFVRVIRSITILEQLILMATISLTNLKKHMTEPIFQIPVLHVPMHLHTSHFRIDLDIRLKLQWVMVFLLIQPQDL